MSDDVVNPFSRQKKWSWEQDFFKTMSDDVVNPFQGKKNGASSRI